VKTIVGFTKIPLALSTYIYTWGAQMHCRLYYGTYTEAPCETWSFGVGLFFQLF